MTTIFPSDHDPESLYKLLTGVVVPRPIAWVTTLGPKNIVNLAPFSCFTFVSSKPPLIGISIGRKQGVLKDTARNIHEHKEFVVNIADHSMVEAIHASAVEHGPSVSEVELLGLKVRSSQLIQTPCLADVPINLECRFHSTTQYGQTGSEFIVGEVVAFHVADNLISGVKINSELLRPVARLGGPTYGILGEIITLAPIAQAPKSVL